MSLVDISFKFPAWEKAIKAAEHRISLTIAASMQTNRGKLFDESGAYNGHDRWPDPELRAGQPLSARGTLRKSLAPLRPTGQAGPDGIVKFAGEFVTIGSTLAYARMMNDGTTKLPGGVLRPKRAKVLVIPLPAASKRSQAGKDAAKGAHRIARLNRLIAALEEELRGVQQPERRAKLRERLERYKKFAANRPANTKFIFATKVKIPARPYDQLNAQDVEEIETTLRNTIESILRGAT